MTVVDAARVERLEDEVEELAARLRLVERAIGAAPAVQARAPGADPAAVHRPRPAPRPRGAVTAPRSAPAAASAGGSEGAAPAEPAVDTPARPALSLEDLLGGRVLAWAGGVAVLLGLGLFLALAISRGWIGQAGRSALAGLASAGLIAVGARLGERSRARGADPSHAALASAAAGIAGAFFALVTASERYALLPVAAGLIGALVVGAVATVLAVRWRAPGVAALGILGALAAPWLLGAPADAGAVAYGLVALASAVGVLVWQRWAWLAVAACATSAVQVTGWLAGPPAGAAVVVGLGVAWALWVGAALGHELRAPSARLRLPSTLLACAAGLGAGAGGFMALEAGGHPTLGRLWVLALALAHAALGLGLERRRSTRGRPVALVLLVIAAVLATTAWELAVDGPLQTVGWALGAGLLGGLARGRRGVQEGVLRLGLGVHLALALLHALLVVAGPPRALEAAPSDAVGALVALAAIALAAFGCARTVHPGASAQRYALDAVALLVLAYLSAVALAGPTLVIAWALQAVALARIAAGGDEPVAAAGGLGFLGLAAGHVLVLEAPTTLASLAPPSLPAALVGLGAVAGAGLAMAALGPPAHRVGLRVGTLAALAYAVAVALDGAAVPVAWAVGSIGLAVGGRRVGGALAPEAAAGWVALALGHWLAFQAPPVALLDGAVLGPAVLGGVAVAAAALATARCGRGLPHWRPAGELLAGAVAIHAASVVIVSGFQPDALAFGTGLDLPVRQQGQVLLSGFWSLCGLGAVVVGLVRRRRAVRAAGLGLLGLAAAKVFLYDLSALDSIYRVLSCVALGLLLLVAGGAWQALRSRELRTVS